MIPFFFRESSIPLNKKFTVLFRGRLTPEAGVEYVLEGAEILKNEDILFKIIGFGQMETEVKEELKKLNLPNVELITKELSNDSLRKEMCGCHISLGQFGNNERLKRTIPHKAFESLAMGIPYITANAEGVAEIFTVGETCLFVNKADPKDLAEKILTLKNNPALRNKLALNGRKLYEEKLTPKILGETILKYILESKHDEYR